MTREKDVQAAVLLYLGARSDCKVWRQNTGNVAGIVARIVGALRKGGMGPAAVAVEKIARDLGLHMKFGVEGCADVSGLMRGGRRLEIEIKSATGRQSEQQRRFQAMIESLNGLYLQVRDVADLHVHFPPETTP